VAGNPALALLQTKPKNSWIFNEPRRRWDNDSRWIRRLIDEIGLENQGRSKLAGFGFDARIEIDDVYVSPFDGHLLFPIRTGDTGIEKFSVLFPIGRAAAFDGVLDIAP